MRVYRGKQIRNVALLSHVGAGKTSLIDAALFDSGAVTRQGKVDDGTSVVDYDPDELKRRMSLNVKVLPVEWQDHKINFIDTPGYPDFAGEVKAGIRVADAALIVVSAEKGPEVGTELTWQYADERNLPRFILINKLDRENTSFSQTIEALRAAFGTKVVPLQIPLGAQGSFKGTINLVSRIASTYENGNRIQAASLPDDLKESIETYREELLEAAVECDDTIMEKFLENEELSEEEINFVIRKSIQECSIVPVLCASALRNVGVQALLDAIVSYGAYPGENASPATELPEDKTAILIFKTTVAQAGTISTFRVYSGSLKADMHLFNVQTKSDERFGQLIIPRGKTQEPATEIAAGDFGAVTKLANTHTGNTLTSDRENSTALEPINFPMPCYTVAIEAKSQSDLDKMGNALARIVEEDPTIQVARDPLSGEMLLSGMGETHIQIVVESIKRKFGADLLTHDQRIAYRETIRKKARANGRHKRQSGGHGQFGDVWLEIEPLPQDGTETFAFEDKIVGGVVPGQFIPGVEKGVRESLKRGFISGHPMIYVKVALCDGKYHPVDSSAQSFEIAASLGMQEAVTLANPVILEPLMIAKIDVPEQNMGDVMSDMNTKRGHVLGMESLENGMQRITASVPQAEMLHYATDLRSITQGRGTFTLELGNYAEVPSNIQQDLINKTKKEVEAHR